MCYCIYITVYLSHDPQILNRHRPQTQTPNFPTMASRELRGQIAVQLTRLTRQTRQRDQGLAPGNKKNELVTIYPYPGDPCSADGGLMVIRYNTHMLDDVL
jgi:hypothetical protein